MADEERTPVAESGEQESGIEWVADDYYRLLSVPFRVRTDTVEFAEALRWHLAPFYSPHPQTAPIPIPIEVHFQEYQEDGIGVYGYYSNNAFVRAGILSFMLEHAIWDLHATVPRIAPDFLFVHAGAVARDGGALLLPAYRDTGKSSLVVALLEQGFGYLSDELGAIDPVSRRVYPFPKRISLDSDALRFFPELDARLGDQRGLSRDLRQRFVRPEDLAASESGPAPVRWIVFPTMDREGPPRLEPMTRALTVERLAENSFNLYRYAERGLILFSLLVQGADAFSLRGGTPTERASLLSARLR